MFKKRYQFYLIYFGHKHIETGPNCSNGIATFLKYHIPLIIFSIFPDLRWLQRLKKSHWQLWNLKIILIKYVRFVWKKEIPWLTMSFTKKSPPRWKFTTGLVPRQYRRADVGTGVVLAYYRVENIWVLVFVRNVTRLGVFCRHWGNTKNGTTPVPKICTGVVL